jgi:hypothetical protein
MKTRGKLIKYSRLIEKYCLVLFYLQQILKEVFKLKLELIVVLFFTGIIPLLHMMFPKLFPAIGTFLLGISVQSWVIVVLLFIVIGQSIVIAKMI